MKTFVQKLGIFLSFMILPILILVLWQIFAEKGILKANLMPPPTTLWKTFCNLFKNGTLTESLKISLLRVICGFVIGSVLGIIFGFLMGLCRPINRLLAVIVSILRPIPNIALIPLFIVLLGLSETAKIAVIAVGTFWPVLLNTIAGTQSVDPKLLQVAYLFKLKKSKIVFRIIFPSSVTSILTGLRLGVGTAWTSVVAAEMIGATSGIGYMIMYAREMALMANLYVSILLLGMIGLLLDQILIRLERKCSMRFRGITE